MTDAEYKKTMDALVEIGRDTLMWDIVALVQRMDEAESAGPVLDPTLWKRGHERLAALKRLAVALLAVQGETHRLRKVLLDEMARAENSWVLEGSVLPVH